MYSWAAFTTISVLEIPEVVMASAWPQESLVADGVTVWEQSLGMRGGMAHQWAVILMFSKDLESKNELQERFSSS